MTVDPALDPQTRMWTIGDYPTIARLLMPISEATVAALDIQPGERVLDVAVGDGNAAILAARRGAEVTGIDLTPAQIERAAERCESEGLSIDLRVGNAEALDLPDASFDVVMSVMGMIFAPDQEAAARELARTCRPGGRIAFTSWVKDGWSGAWRTQVANLMPESPAGPQPDEWGDPLVVCQRMEAAGLQANVEIREFTWRFPSTEIAFQTFVTAAGPFVMFMDIMQQQGKAELARTVVLDTMDDTNVATDGTCVLPAPYLLVTATR